MGRVLGVVRFFFFCEMELGRAVDTGLFDRLELGIDGVRHFKHWGPSKQREITVSSPVVQAFIEAHSPERPPVRNIAERI